MNHQGTRRIETERLVLRQFSIDDAEAMYLGWAGDPEVTRFMSWPTHESPEDSQAIIEKWQNDAILRSDYNWCITLRRLSMCMWATASAGNTGTRGSHLRRCQQ